MSFYYMGPAVRIAVNFWFKPSLAYIATNFTNTGGFLRSKHKVVVFLKFHVKCGGSMLITPSSPMSREHGNVLGIFGN